MFRSGVRAAGGGTSAPTDTQLILVNVVASGPAAPTQVDLAAESDSGTSPTDNITNASTLNFDIAGTQSGALVELLAGSTIVGSATASGTSTRITLNQPIAALTGVVNLTARQTVNSETSASSPVLSVNFDSTVPVLLSSVALPSTLVAGQTSRVDLFHPEEDFGLVYALTTAPAGATINASNGLFTWTPTLAQVGNQSVVLTLTDLAGNVQTQNFTINVTEPALASVFGSIARQQRQRYFASRSGANFPAAIGDERLATRWCRGGVQAAYFDLLYNSNILQLVDASPITYGSGFDVALTGDTSVPGVIDELGGRRSSSVGTGGGAIVVADVLVRAIGVGSATISLNPAEDANSAFLLYNRSGAVATDKLLFNNASISVQQSFSVADDTFSVLKDSRSNSLAVLSNDPITTGSNPTLTILSTSTPSAGGSVQILGQTLTYTPASNYVGAETFTYVVQDQFGIQATASVTVTIQEFVPRAIGGSLVNQDGSAAGLSNVQLLLSGTAINGESISRPVTTDTSGNFAADNLPPGQYIVTAPMLPFRNPTTGSVSILSNATDGDSLNNSLNIGSIKSRYMDVRDFLGTTTGRGLGIAATPGASQQWVDPSGIWRGYQSVIATIAADESQLTLAVTTADNRSGTATLNLATHTAVQLRGAEGGSRYIRLATSPAQLNLPAPNADQIVAGTTAVRPTSMSSVATLSTANSIDAALASLSNLDDVINRNRAV